VKDEEEKELEEEASCLRAEEEARLQGEEEALEAEQEEELAPRLKAKHIAEEEEEALNADEESEEISVELNGSVGKVASGAVVDEANCFVQQAQSKKKNKTNTG
jgi:hypothetical protein